MQKSIITLAAALLAVTSFQSTAEARGIGGGFGLAFSPAFGRHNGPDPSILRNAEAAQRRAHGRGYGYVIERRRVVVPSINYARIHAEKAAETERSRRAEKAAEARAAEAEKAKRAARLAAAAEVQAAAAKARKSAAIAAAKPAVVGGTDLAAIDNRALDVAQAEQNARAETLYKRLNGPIATPAATKAAPVEISQPVPVKASEQIRPVPAASPTAVSGGDCKRFIPGAGLTVSVPCSE